MSWTIGIIVYCAILFIVVLSGKFLRTVDDTTKQAILNGH